MYFRGLISSSAGASGVVEYTPVNPQRVRVRLFQGGVNWKGFCDRKFSYSAVGGEGDSCTGWKPLVRLTPALVGMALWKVTPRLVFPGNSGSSSEGKLRTGGDGD